MSVICQGCGALHAAIEGAVHNYMLSSPGCWAQYGELLAREYQSPPLFASAHRYTVDAYALQHPGAPDDRRAWQSVRLHYLSLHLVFAHKKSHSEALRAMQTWASGDFAPLPDPPTKFEITISDLTAARDADHALVAKRWAKSAYDAWGSLKAYAEKKQVSGVHRRN